MKQVLAFFVLVAVVITTKAQETISVFQFHGFSEDLRYAILEDYSPALDGGGSSEFVFVDVNNNSYASRRYIYSLDSLDETTIRKTARKNAQPVFTKLNVTGKKMGTKVNNDAFEWKGVKYMLNISSFDEELNEYNSVKAKMDLSISYNGKTQTLQKDKNVPQSRGSASNYTIAAVYMIENKIAVVVEYSVGPGFEGQPDKYHMLVTGALN